MGKLEEIAEVLKKRIDGGLYPPNVRLPSEYELADELGVNRITLNKAVNRLIADGYLRRGSSSRDGTYIRDRSELVKGSLGLLIRCGNLYADQLMHGVIDGALRNNYLLSVMAPELEEVRIAERKMLANGIEGVFLASYANFPLSAPGVLIDSFFDADPERNSITSDVYSGGLQMAEAQLEKGHREIVVVMYSSFPFARNPRCAAFLEAFRHAEMPKLEERFFYSNNRSREQLLKMIFSAFPDTTAIVGENDTMTFELWQALHRLDPARAERISFAGFGNLPGVQSVFPFVTVDQHPYELGCRAVQLYLDWRADGRNRHELVPVSVMNADCIREV